MDGQTPFFATLKIHRGDSGTAWIGCGLQQPALGPGTHAVGAGPRGSGGQGLVAERQRRIGEQPLDQVGRAQMLG